MANTYRLTDIEWAGVDALVLYSRTSNGYYGYNKNESRMIYDFLDYLHDNVSQDWWCDGVAKHMHKAKICAYEYMEYCM